MISFRIYLNRSQSTSPWGPAEASSQDAARNRQGGFLARLGEGRKQRQFQADFVTYFADRTWMPGGPVEVHLLGSLDTRDLVASNQDEYELSLVEEGTPAVVEARGGLKERLANLAAAAAVVLAPGQAAFASRGADPSQARLELPALPSHREAHSDAAGFGPPVTRLKGHELRSADVQTPAGADALGKPMRVASFHSNTAASHTNTAQSHTNTWGNHANIQTTHSNVWQNHSNINAGPTTPHTNMVPGDFIF